MGSTSAMRPSAAGPASSDPRSLGDRRSCALPSTPLAPGRGGLFQRRHADAPVARRRQGIRGLDLVVQRRPDTEAALKLLKRLLRNQPVAPERIVTDGLGSYPAALDQLRSPAPAFTRPAEGESAENSHCRSDDESDSSSCSSRRCRPSASSPPTQRFTTPFTPRDISSADRPSAVFAPELKRPGQWLSPEISSGCGTVAARRA